MLTAIILATLFISAVSVIGILVVFRQPLQHEKLRPLISLAAGSLLAVAFLDLLPEAVAESNLAPDLILGVALIGVLIFFIFERVLHWHHCSDPLHGHQDRHGKKNLIYFNLIGDATHNLIDGFLIAGAFLLNFETGIAVTLAVLLHEIPQEISDFGVLVYAGLSKARALVYNVVVALTAVIGAIAFYFFGASFAVAIPLMAALAAGNFIYLATADLIPELHHETQRSKVALHTLWLLVGVLVVYLVNTFTSFLVA